MSDMKRCPFPYCPGNEYPSSEIVGEVDGSYSDVTVYFVQCSYCDAQGPTGKTEAEAIERWNLGREG